MEAKELLALLGPYMTEEYTHQLLIDLATALDRRTKRMRELEVALDEAKAELQQYSVVELRDGDATREQLISNNELLRAHNAAQQRSLTEAHEQIRRLASTNADLQRELEGHRAWPSGGAHVIVDSHGALGAPTETPARRPSPESEIAQINRALVQGDLGATTSGLPIDDPGSRARAPVRSQQRRSLNAEEQSAVREGFYALAIRDVKRRLQLSNSEAKDLVYTWARQGGFYYRSPPRSRRSRRS